MRTWRRTVGPVAICLVIVVSLSGTIGIFELGGGAVGHAPSSSSPPWPILETNAAVYDAAENYDLWFLTDGTTWSYAGGNWNNLSSVAGTPTDMEENSRMVYDASDNSVVLYGGAIPRVPSVLLNDTWLFSGSRWVNETAQVHGAPPAGTLGMMAYDSTDRAVVLYGEQITGEYQPDRSTWEYSALSWTNESVSGPRPIVSQGPPDLTGFTDDPSDGYVLFYSLFGGCTSLCPILWTYAAGVWTNRTATVIPLPSLTLFEAFTFDSSAHDIVAVGGCQNSSSYTCSEPFGTFTYRAGAWTDVTPRAGPSPREFASWVDDPSDDGVMIVGGCCWADFSGLSLIWQDVWIYTNGLWSERLPWGGGSPFPMQNDGFWIAVGTIGVPVLLVWLRAGPSKNNLG